MHFSLVSCILFSNNPILYSVITLYPVIFLSDKSWPIFSLSFFNRQFIIIIIYHLSLRIILFHFSQQYISVCFVNYYLQNLSQYIPTCTRLILIYSILQKERSFMLQYGYISSNGLSYIPIFQSLTHSRQHATKISACSASRDDCSKGSCISKYRRGRKRDREKMIFPSLKLTLVTQSLRRHFQGCQRYSFENWYETKIERYRDEYMYNTIQIMGQSLNITCLISTRWLNKSFHFLNIWIFDFIFLLSIYSWNKKIILLYLPSILN